MRHQLTEPARQFPTPAAMPADLQQPLVSALRRRATDVVDAELHRLRARLSQVPEGIQAELAHTVRRVADELLHTPASRISQLWDGPAGTSYTEALRDLFALDLPNPAEYPPNARQLPASPGLVADTSGLPLLTWRHPL